jgi:diamine N-acetyltransferase
MLTLKPISLTSPDMPECIALDVPPHKAEEGYVVAAAYTLAHAHTYNKRGTPYECRAIYAHAQIVGLIAYCYYTNDPVFAEVCYRIRPILVDARHQDKGYELEALRQLITEIETLPHGNATAIFASYDPEETDCASHFAAAGFTITDLNRNAEDPDDNDIIVRRAL